MFFCYWFPLHCSALLKDSHHHHGNTSLQETLQMPLSFCIYFLFSRLRQCSIDIIIEVYFSVLIICVCLSCLFCGTVVCMAVFICYTNKAELRSLKLTSPTGTGTWWCRTPGWVRSGIREQWRGSALVTDGFSRTRQSSNAFHVKKTSLKSKPLTTGCLYPAAMTSYSFEK